MVKNYTELIKASKYKDVKFIYIYIRICRFCITVTLIKWISQIASTKDVHG